MARLRKGSGPRRTAPRGGGCAAHPRAPNARMDAPVRCFARPGAGMPTVIARSEQ
ncbi:hypothetical protein GZL_01961 [Streptomyces sp. 769]|nr:hypothetical protein GZL_01961 [Streptomyces sp. 769]